MKNRRSKRMNMKGSAGSCSCSRNSYEEFESEQQSMNSPSQKMINTDSESD